MCVRDATVRHGAIDMTNRLFVLSDAQSAYSFDLDKLSTPKVANVND